MQLTHWHIRVLQGYWNLHAFGITPNYLLQVYWLRIILFFVLCAVGGLVHQQSAVGGGIVLGFAIAMVLRDGVEASKLVYAWPLMNEITDWKRVQDLLAPAGEDLGRTEEGV